MDSIRMNINTILKGGLIALFFSTQIMANPETGTPSHEIGWSIDCSSQFGTFAVGNEGTYTSEIGKSVCRDLIRDKAEQDFNQNYSCPYNYPNQISLSSQDGSSSIDWDRICQSDGGSKKRIVKDYTFNISNLQTVNTKSCPPEDLELIDYIYPIRDENGKITACDDDNPAFQKCPQGYFKYAVNNQCVEIQCPPTGTADTIWGSGSTYTNNSGTYCNSQCAFSTQGGQNDSGSKGNIPLKVVSNGAVCGDGTDNWHADGNGEDNCTKSNLDTGSIFVTCSNGNTDTGEETEKPVDLGDQKVEEPLELIPVLENCSPDDVTCEVRNLQEKVENENKELKAEQQEQHNKKIEAQEKATIKLVNAIQELKEFNTIGQQQITAAIKADTGTGSSGGGSGTVTLDGEGAGLEDSEIGEAFGGLDDEINEEIVTLSDYSAPYSNWISTSACPSTQSITLTINGISSTLDADNTPMCSFFVFLGKILLAASYVGVAFMIQRSI